jgi:hypothetical protein
MEKPGDAVKVWLSIGYAVQMGEAVPRTIRPSSPARLRNKMNSWDREFSRLIAMLRDIFGNPFRPVSISPSILTWNDAIVVRLAQAAYEERHLPAGTLDTNRLAVLADALEEAGCTSEDILGHLRGPGPHVRGCWAVDLLLGKE